MPINSSRDPYRPRGRHRYFDKGRSSSAKRKRLSAPALRTFLALADLWRLTEKERILVLACRSRSYRSWCKQAREHGDLTLNMDVLTRISTILGIHKALSTLFATERLGIEWLRTAHNAIVFGGRPPLSLVTSGSRVGLFILQRFLDGACGGLYMQPNTIDDGFRAYEDAEIVLK